MWYPMVKLSDLSSHVGESFVFEGELSSAILSGHPKDFST
jgi:hypothetical protein